MKCDEAFETRRKVRRFSQLIRHYKKIHGFKPLGKVANENASELGTITCNRSSVKQATEKLHF